MIRLDDLRMGARFCRRLLRYLRTGLTVPEAERTLRRRLEQREAAFLELVKPAIYLNPASPYRELLRLAGCEYGDLERLVRQAGVEGALRTLLRHGVYLTVGEFKGRKRIIRGRTELQGSPDRFRNPLSESHVALSTSGSRGAGTPAPIDLAFVRNCAVDTLLALDARGAGASAKAHWQVPGGGAIARLVEYSSFGSPAARWFSQIDPADPALHPRYRWSARIMRWTSLLAGAPLPRPEHVPLDDPRPILRWLTESLRAGARPHLFSFTSSAVALCQAAARAGIDLTGAYLTVVGEPVTATRMRVLRDSGAEVAPRYAIIECSSIGHGCLSPEVSDEVHFLNDLHALVQPGPELPIAGVSPNGLFLSSLGLAAPFVLLNVSMGDEAVVTERPCGCPLARLGWETHLHTIRSREKLTAGGMTFLGTDVVRVLEEVLPARFGGGPTDYQLLEEEAAAGRPRLRLLAHPAIGVLDEARVVDTFLMELGKTGRAEEVMARMWHDAGFLSLDRRPPYTTATGKILHLHIRRATEKGAEAPVG